MSSSNEVSFRGPTQGDFKFIFDSWLRSWRKSPWAGVIPNNVYYPLTRSNIEQLVGRGAQFTVACLSSAPERILGWVCYEQVGPKAVVHYLYVKDPYLSLGIGEQLVERVPGEQPGLYTYRYRQVVDACPGWWHTPEVARRK